MAEQTMIVVPCYNEGERLDVLSFVRFARSEPRIAFLFVDDGSQDDTIDRLCWLHKTVPEQMHFLRLGENRGKAEAVRQGMLAALGIALRDSELVSDGTINVSHCEEPVATLAGFWDADLATPLEAIPEFRRIFCRFSQVEAVFGSRLPLIGRSIRRNTSRAILGRVFARTASWVIGLHVYDTQCGAKLFRVSDLTRKLFVVPFTTRWIFDVELFVRLFLLAEESRQRMETGGLYELPLDEWYDVAGSKLRRSDFVRAVGELAGIWWHYRRWGASGYDPRIALAESDSRTTSMRAAG